MPFSICSWEKGLCMNHIQNSNLKSYLWTVRINVFNNLWVMNTAFGYFPAAAGFALSHIKFASYHLWFFRHMNTFCLILILLISPFDLQLGLHAVCSVLFRGNCLVTKKEMILLCWNRSYVCGDRVTLLILLFPCTPFVFCCPDESCLKVNQSCCCGSVCRRFTCGSTSIDNVTAGVLRWWEPVALTSLIGVSTEVKHATTFQAEERAATLRFCYWCWVIH